jgi:hypothetical protein
VNDLSARALLTLQEARRFVYRDENDGSRDDILTDAVNDVSDSIWDHCEREFKDTTASPGPDARIFAMNAAGWIDLAPYDLRAVTSVKLYTDLDVGSQQTLTSEEYRLQPAGKALGGTYLTIQALTPANVELWPGFGWQATVTGSWGMAAVPGPVKLACKEWVSNICQNPAAFASAAMGGYAVSPEIDFSPSARAGMPPAVRYRLKRYCRSI